MKQATPASGKKPPLRAVAAAAADNTRPRVMPETFPPIRYLSPALLTLLAVMLGACSGGDFGRTREDFRSDDMHRWVGLEATSSVALRPSQFQLTDNERQLRDLAFPL